MLAMMEHHYPGSTKNWEVADDTQPKQGLLRKIEGASVGFSRQRPRRVPGSIDGIKVQAVWDLIFQRISSCRAGESTLKSLVILGGAGKAPLIPT